MALNLKQYLRAEVPEREGELADVWVDREQELAQAIALARAGLEHPPGLPLAIQGSARVGKSHMLRRVANEISGEFNLTVNARLTSAHRDVSTLLVQLLDQVLDALEDAGEAERIQPARHVRQRFASIIDGNASSLQLSVSDALNATLKATVAGTATGKASAGKTVAKMLGLPILEGTLGLALGAEAAGGAVNTTTAVTQYGRFEASMITRLIALAHTLASADREWRMLLVVDDFDLLKRRDDQGLDPWPFLRELCVLAELPGVFLLTTVRADTYEQHKKAFYRLVRLRPFEDPARLSEIYGRHRELWYSEHEDPFPHGFVSDLAARSDGRPGLFLEMLRDVFEDAGGPVLGSLDDFLEREWVRLVREEPRRAEVLSVAVQEQQGRLFDAESVSSIRSSAVSRWIFEDYSSVDAVTVNPILGSFLARRRAT